MAEAASIQESARRRPLPDSCPLREPATMRLHKDAVRAGSELSLRVQAFLGAKPREEVGECLRSVMEQSRLVFQPWSMEILFVTGILGEVRFSTLEQVLGASSRTVAAKLASLAEGGYLERRVEPGPPLRTSYRLTHKGRGTVAAASPLFSHLNLAALESSRP